MATAPCLPIIPSGAAQALVEAVEMIERSWTAVGAAARHLRESLEAVDGLSETLKFSVLVNLEDYASELTGVIVNGSEISKETLLADARDIASLVEAVLAIAGPASE